MQTIRKIILKHLYFLLLSLDTISSYHVLFTAILPESIVYTCVLSFSLESNSVMICHIQSTETALVKVTKDDLQ